ncbi:CTP synthase N-terminus-domain-containing protein [Ephemerocybe angulata]|uniref:CTP synthase N-terminus-domain-containing protein n=1 Tax=Ephemerocybe angulata TaxID=980116 RepID=A0A8H6I183_9AGAR|nr:CTP synthase N-terminus-domain-containing protein [Tulosesus angulatus]
MPSKARNSAHVQVLPRPTNIAQRLSTSTSTIATSHLTPAPTDCLPPPHPATLNPATKEKISIFCHVQHAQVVGVHDVNSVYHVPLLLQWQGIVEFFTQRLTLDTIKLTPTDLARGELLGCFWRELTAGQEGLFDTVTIVLVGIERISKIPVDDSGEELDVCIVECSEAHCDVYVSSGAPSVTESAPFVEAMRLSQFRVGHDHSALIHVSLVPDMHGEQKTKPMQTTVHSLRGLGLLPDLITCRLLFPKPLKPATKAKVTMFCHIPLSMPSNRPAEGPSKLCYERQRLRRLDCSHRPRCTSLPCPHPLPPIQQLLRILQSLPPLLDIEFADIDDRAPTRAHSQPHVAAQRLRSSTPLQDLTTRGRSERSTPPLITLAHKSPSVISSVDGRLLPLSAAFSNSAGSSPLTHACTFSGANLTTALTA